MWNRPRDSVLPSLELPEVTFTEQHARQRIMADYHAVVIVTLASKKGEKNLNPKKIFFFFGPLYLEINSGHSPPSSYTDPLIMGNHLPR